MGGGGRCSGRCSGRWGGGDGRWGKVVGGVWMCGRWWEVGEVVGDGVGVDR